jgi:hypothetical protein
MNLAQLSESGCNKKQHNPTHTLSLRVALFGGCWWPDGRTPQLSQTRYSLTWFQFKSIVTVVVLGNQIWDSALHVCSMSHVLMRRHNCLLMMPRRMGPNLWPYVRDNPGRAAMRLCHPRVTVSVLFYVDTWCEVLHVCDVLRVQWRAVWNLHSSVESSLLPSDCEKILEKDSLRHRSPSSSTTEPCMFSAWSCLASNHFKSCPNRFLFFKKKSFFPKKTCTPWYSQPARRLSSGPQSLVTESPLRLVYSTQLDD